MRTQLTELPELYEECQEALVPGGTGLRERVSGSHSGSGLFLDERAVAARTDLLAFLVTWAALVVEEGGAAKPQHRSPAHLTAFLVGNLDWLLEHPAGSDFTAELAAASRGARLVAEESPGAHAVLGDCVQEGCDGLLLAPRTHGTPRAGIRCTSGHEWQTHQWLELQRRMHLRVHRA